MTTTTQVTEQRIVIQFRAKIREFVDGERYFDLKRTIGAKDADRDALRRHPVFGAYANSNLMDGILRGHVSRIFRNRDWCSMNELPPGVTVDDSGFLAVVSIEIPNRLRAE